MRSFADSSALVKLYADEPGHEMVRDLAQIIVAQVARVEVPAALWRKRRTGELFSEQAALLVAEFEADWFGVEESPRRFEVVRMTALIVEDAARLTGIHNLRAYDAVQLATARAVRTADPDMVQVVVFDKTLRDAAAVEGFTTLG
ncbi:type II toxin-antitoxin system VapC family toxin [Pseudonocardia spinosispora]|uniref:type II toxin-antitoxin system VapC family toxin n=1 Tax=Pseudonocardia spinosispora TaxID=103441 RepID=UPI00041B68D0|nr:type II toxin-antitoxin system VapC family toxin [Pseudonocardia spinosispora]